MADEIVNRVAKSPLQTIDLADFVPQESELMTIDISEFLENNVVFREKYFRNKVADYGWEKVEGKYVNFSNTNELIVPLWAYMILSLYSEKAKFSAYTSNTLFFEKCALFNLSQSDLSKFKDKPVIVKGCGKYDFSPDIYVQVVKILKPYVKSISFGEACSSVPVWKRK